MLSTLSTENQKKMRVTIGGLYIDYSDACYWDSFGMVPPLDVSKLCKNKRLIYNKDQIQNLNQEACGYYCLAFLHFMNT
jgi:hypothetical protein